MTQQVKRPENATTLTEEQNMQELTTTSTASALTEQTPPSVDEIEALHYIGEAVSEYLHPAMPFAKYTKGDYTYGRDKTPIPLGTKVTALMYEARHSAEHWENKKLVERHIGKVASSFKVPDVKLLNGDTPKGAEKPWKHCVYLAMVLPDGTVVMFASQSAGGRGAFYGLFGKFKREALQHRGMMPIIALGSHMRNYPNFGDVPEPLWELVGWAAPPDAALAISCDVAEMAGGAAVETASSTANEANDVAWDAPQKTLRDGTDDETPF
jgi:hypothetical protein